ncbi:S1C family serine protease [Allobranchiibius sp. CTAmp26]|uniref:S1C family serine protease n=1 Tax=Allobranchiibius sp. CTAmp26 TaxID=2815214 RepID=UPI001AA11738|nr:trypsin-like peptidase domain-containing protein [Allobranchiibius sp. CTAmp26]MBO1754233.1 trypsin-like peptidase domain-containing protein [Allobranchiibius sp. CTAmp26]
MTPSGPQQPFPSAGPPANPEQPRKGRAGLLAGGALVLALVAGAVGGAGGAIITHHYDADATDVAGSDQVSAIAKRSLPSVVTIQIADSTGKPVGTGSGFVIRSSGYIVTNNHVAEGAGASGRLTVQFSDDSQASARIVGADASYDLAVIKVNHGTLPTLAYGDSDALIVGQSVIAVGAPLGLTGSVTTGIVSALNRPVSTGQSMSDVSYLNAVQTDAAINPGNSGGPLLDMHGRVVGVNSAIASTGGDGSGSQQSGNIGVGFAIPSAQVQRTVDQLIRTGKAEHPSIGIQVDPNYEGTGVRVGGVDAGGGAQRAGVATGDVITAIDGVEVAGPTAFIVALRSKPLGATVTLTITSNGGSRSVAVQTNASNN